MNTEQTEKKTRTPRNFDSILSGAQKLTLKERVVNTSYSPWVRVGI
jgi:hypothetical protein